MKLWWLTSGLLECPVQKVAVEILLMICVSLLLLLLTFLQDGMFDEQTKCPSIIRSRRLSGGRSEEAEACSELCDLISF